jgi:hypothetical protein
MILSEGFDFPDLECVILARPTMSFRLHAQMCGRAFRRGEDESADIAKVILDHAGNYGDGEGNGLGDPLADRAWIRHDVEVQHLHVAPGMRVRLPGQGLAANDTGAAGIVVDTEYQEDGEVRALVQRENAEPEWVAGKTLTPMKPEPEDSDDPVTGGRAWRRCDACGAGCSVGTRVCPECGAPLVQRHRPVELDDVELVAAREAQRARIEAEVRAAATKAKIKDEGWILKVIDARLGKAA